MLAGEALEYCKLSLSGDSGMSSGDQNANKKVDRKYKAQKVSVGNKDSVGRCTPGHRLCSGRKVLYILLMS